MNLILQVVYLCFSVYFYFFTQTFTDQNGQRWIRFRVKPVVHVDTQQKVNSEGHSEVYSQHQCSILHSQESETENNLSLTDTLEAAFKIVIQEPPGNNLIRPQDLFACEKQLFENIVAGTWKSIESLKPFLATSCGKEDHACLYSRSENEDFILSAIENLKTSKQAMIEHRNIDYLPGFHFDFLGQHEPTEEDSFWDPLLGYKPIIPGSPDPLGLQPWQRILLRLVLLCVVCLLAYKLYKVRQLDAAAKAARKLSRLPLPETPRVSLLCADEALEETKTTRPAEPFVIPDPQTEQRNNDEEKVINIWTKESETDSSEIIEEPVLVFEEEDESDVSSDTDIGLEELEFGKETDQDLSDELMWGTLSSEAKLLIKDALVERTSKENASVSDRLLTSTPVASGRKFPHTVGITVKYGTEDSPCVNYPESLEDSLLEGIGKEDDLHKEPLDPNFFSPRQWLKNISSTGMKRSLKDAMEKVTSSEILNGSAEGVMLTTVAATGLLLGSRSQL